MKKLIYISLFILLILPIKNIYAASNPYPQTQEFDGVISTPCTRVVWQETYDRLGIALPGWGNAVDWYKNASYAGYQVGNEAKANSIAVYSGFYGYGHVAFVIEVYEDSMKLIENKSTGEGKIESIRSKGIGSGEQSGVYLLGFIYVNESKVPSNNSNITSVSRSSNSYLKNLEIEDIDINFDKDNYFYNIVVPNEKDRINITGESLDSKSKVEGLKEYELKPGENIITIKVVAEDESESNYIINITREELKATIEEKKNTTKKDETLKKDNKNIFYYIIVTLLIILIIILVIFLKRNRKFVNKKENKNENS